VRQIAKPEWDEITNQGASVPDGYYVQEFVNGQLIAVFADAKHVELVDMFTGNLCMPPKMFLVPAFKAVAKYLGPLVATFQCTYRSRSYPWVYTPNRVDDAQQWKTGFVDLLWCPGSNTYDLVNAFDKYSRKVLNLSRYSTNHGRINFSSSLYTIVHGTSDAMLHNDSEYIIYRNLGEQA